MRSYVIPHLDILLAFYCNFVRSGNEWNRSDLEHSYRHYWEDRPGKCDQLTERLSGLDIEPFVRVGEVWTQESLRPTQRVETVALIGLETTNACQLIVSGQPTVVLALEVWGTRVNDGRRLDWREIPIWLAHEYSHVVRYREGDSPFSRFLLDGTLNYPLALDHIPLIELLVDEGLATTVGYHVGGARTPAQALI